MINPTEKQIQNRWDLLPEELRDAIFSEENNALIDSIGEDYVLTEKQKENLSRIVSDVIFGFISVADAEKQIKEELEVEPEEAADISKRITAKIFAPLKTQIEKIFSPSEKESGNQAATSVPSAPFSLDKLNVLEIKPEPVSPVAGLPKIDVQAPAENKPVSFNEVIKPGQTKPEEKPAAPFVLHKEEEAKPVLGSKKSLGGLFGFLNKKPVKEESGAGVAVQVDFGSDSAASQEKPAASGMVSTKREPASKIIHYGAAEESPFGFGSGSRIPMPKPEDGAAKTAPENFATIEIENGAVKPEMISGEIRPKNIVSESAIPVSKIVDFAGAGEIKTPVVSTSEPVRIPLPPKPPAGSPGVYPPIPPKPVEASVKRVDFTENDAITPEVVSAQMTQKEIYPDQNIGAVSTPAPAPQQAPAAPPKPASGQFGVEAKPEDDIIDLRTFKIGK